MPPLARACRQQMEKGRRKRHCGAPLRPADIGNERAPSARPHHAQRISRPSGFHQARLAALEAREELIFTPYAAAARRHISREQSTIRIVIMLAAEAAVIISRRGRRFSFLTRFYGPSSGDILSYRVARAHMKCRVWRISGWA